jgi:hypothetical protein
LKTLFDEKSLLLADPFDFAFESELNDLISIKREAFKTICEFAGIMLKTGSPGRHILTEEEREANLRKIRMAMMSPIAEEAQKELKQVLEQEKNSENEEKHKKRSNLFNRMRNIFKKRSKKEKV